MVYVISKNGQPLMPTTRYGKVRRLFKEGKIKIIKRCPFTIQLNYDSGNIVQEVSLGIDAGSKMIGLSATTPSKVLYEAEVELRNNIVDLLAIRRTYRRGRRNRKLRYRSARFSNRIHSKHKGWLAPSIEQKINTHMKIIEDIHKILPISKIIVECAAFDIQKIKNPEIQGKEYQEGEQKGFSNVREAVLFRDSYECQYCHGKSGDKILQVHHIESRKTGGNSMGNLITLCKTCHEGYHTGKIDAKFERNKKFNDSAFMGIMRWTFYERLKDKYNKVSMTFGYITKQIRYEYQLPKEHYIDARCISGNPNAKSDGVYYYYKKVRCHNRQLRKANTPKGGKVKNNQAPKCVYGYQLFDLVEYQKKLYYIFSRRSNGYFDIRTLNGEKVNKGSLNYKHLKLVQHRKGMLIERRVAFSPHT